MNSQFEQELEERRCGHSKVTLKKLSKANNKLLERRNNKNKTNNDPRKLQSQISKRSARFNFGKN